MDLLRGPRAALRTVGRALDILGAVLDQYRLRQALAGLYGLVAIGIAVPLLLRPHEEAQAWTFVRLAQDIRLDWFGGTLLATGAALVVLALIGPLPRWSAGVVFAIVVHLALIGTSASYGAIHSDGAAANASAYSGLALLGMLTGWVCLIDGRRLRFTRRGRKP